MVRLILCLVALGAPLHAHASAHSTEPESHPARPKLAGRVVKHFDFEERLTNPLEVPRHWYRSQNDPSGTTRPGFPPWNAGELDYQTARSGEGSVRLPVSGGSACLRLEPGVIPVLPDADYSVSAFMRTAGGTHARARLAARLLDASGAVIPGSERTTDPVSTRGEWVSKSLQIRGTSPDAAFLQIDMEMLQPREWQSASLPDFVVWPEDFNAEAWFDDVRVTQLPRVELRIEHPDRAQSPGQVGIVRSDTAPSIRAHLRDLTGQSLVARLSVRGLDGHLIDSITFNADRGPGGTRWSPTLPAKGWFEAKMELFADGEFVGSAVLPFGWLDPHDRHDRDGSRFLILADALPKAMFGQLAAFARSTGAGSLVIPAWQPGMRADSIESDLTPIEGAITESLGAGIQVGLSLASIPTELASRARLDPRDTLRLIADQGEIVRPYIDPLIDRYGQSVQRWFFGSPSVGPMTIGNELVTQLTRADRLIGDLVPGPILSIPWDGATGVSPALAGFAPDGLFVTIPEGIGAGGIGPWIDALASSLISTDRRSNDPIELTILPRLLDHERFGRDISIDQFCKMVVEAWSRIDDLDEAGIRLRFGLVDPWFASDSDDPDMAPAPAIVAMSGLASHLVDRRVIMRLPTNPGIHAYLLGPAGSSKQSRTGAIVVWSDGRDPQANLSLYLGPDQITLSDVYGNRSALAPFSPSEGDRIRTHDVPLTEAPVIVEGVDERIVVLGAGFRIEPPFIPAINESHERELVIANPFSSPIDIRYFITRPGSDEQGRRDRSWSVTPRSGSIQIEPKGEGRIPITVVPSAVEEAGPKEFVLDAQVTSDRAYGWIRMVTIAELGLPGIRADVNATLSPGPSGPDVTADVLIVNTGNEPITLEIAAFATGYPRQRSAVSSIQPGASAVRRFTFPRGASRLQGERIVVSIVDTASGGRLNAGIAATSVP